MINDTLLNPEARPSMPSIRFIALQMNTMTRTVRGMPIQGDSSCIPIMPYRLFIHNPDKGIRQAAMSWTRNLER